MSLTLPPQPAAFAYHDFIAHMDALVAADKTTGTNHSPDYVAYTKQNLQRNDRIYRTTVLEPALVAATQGLQKSYRWLVIAEGWCGDVFQSLPVIALAAETNPRITLEVILRDEHAPIMDHFLTDGGRAIPILVVIDPATDAVITHWGPRPAPAQQMVRDYKALADKPPYMEFVKELQLWYAHDRAHTLQAELLSLVQGLE